MGLDAVQIGLLTTAGINRNLLAQRYDGAPYAFAAVGSRDLSRAQAYAAEHGLERAHGSYEELLADPGLDAVYIALPNVFHHEWTMRALAAGKHVLCEKPYTRRPAEVEQAWDEADARGLVLMEAFMWRHSRQTALMLELLPQIGELQSITSTFAYPLTGEDNVRLVPEIGGGSLLDVGCYCVSASRLVAGREPDRVYGEQSLRRGGVDEHFASVMRFGEVLATFQCGFGSFETRGIVAVGATGELRAPDPWHSREARVFLNDVEHAAEDIDSYRLQLQNFAAAVRGDGRPLLGRADALGQARALDALLRSAETGAAITLGE